MTIFLITFFLIFALICVKNIRYGVYAVIFSMPLYLWRFSIFGIPTTVLEIMIYILFLVWILNKTKKNNFYPALAEGSNGFSRFRKNNFILSTGITLLFLGLALSTLHSSDLRTSLGICKGWFFDPFLFFIIFISAIKEKIYIISSLASWVFSGVVVSLISIFYLLNNNLSFDDRLSAFYISPNYLAMYISPVFLIVLFFLLYRRKMNSEELKILDIKYWILNLRHCFGARALARICAKPLGFIFGSKPLFQNQSANFLISNIQYPIFIVIISIPLFFTYSYGAFLGIFAGVIWLFYRIYSGTILNFPIQFVISKRNEAKRSGVRNLLTLPYKQNSYISSIKRSLSRTSFKMTKSGEFKTRLFLKILILIVLIAFISITAVKFNQIINSESRSSFHSRLMIWNTSVEIIKDNPVFGIGPGAFQETYLSYAEKFDEPYLEWAVTQPHNTFLAFYLQTGLIGLIGFILILVWFFYRRRGGSRPAPTVATVLIIYILVHGLVDTMYWKNDLSLMFWLVIGLAWCCDDSVS